MGDTRALTWRLIEDFADLRAIEPAWRALHERSADPQPVRTPEWLSTWWRVFGAAGGRALRVMAIASGGELVGLVPLLRRRVRRDGLFPVVTLEWLGTGEPPGDDICAEYTGALAARGREAEVAAVLADALLSGAPCSGAPCSGALGAWDELRLARMSADDPFVPLLGEALRARGVDTDVRVTAECPRIELPSSWDDYLARLGARHRAFARGTLRDLEIWAGPGGLALRRAEGLNDLAEGWRVLRALHRERWPGGGAFRSERFTRFHAILTSHLLRGEGGALDLSWIEVRGRPIAALYDIVHRGAVLAYQSGRSLDVPPQVRPGIAIHLLAIRRAIERGDHTYDFLAPVQPYKRKLGSASIRRLVTLSATAPSLRARAFRAARDLCDRFWPVRPPPDPAAPGRDPSHDPS